MVVKERTVRVQASIPASQADALKALAAASGVPVGRAVHYAVERLLDVARREGSVAVASGLAPERPQESGNGVVAEVAAALDLRVPAPDPEPAHSTGRNGVPVLALPAAPDGEQAREQPVERPVEQGAEQSAERPPEHRTEHGTEYDRASQAEQAADAAPCLASDAVARAGP